MQQNFTREILVKYLYNETNEVEAKTIETALQNDVSLQQEFAQLRHVKNKIDEDGGDSPSSGSIQKILNYSKQKQTAEV
jgi:beta-galactosidase GanA